MIESDYYGDGCCVLGGWDTMVGVPVTMVDTKVVRHRREHDPTCTCGPSRCS